MGVADRYWHNLLICIIVLCVTGMSAGENEIVLTKTYQRGTKTCFPVFNCHQGQQIKECASSLAQETCEPCPGDEVQPDLISSVLKLDSLRKCFKLQEARCSTRDTVPAREKDGKIFCAKFCKCDITKCFWGETSCECDKKKEGCPPNYQLNGITGDCEPCPELTYKHGNNCGPCEFNETAFRIFVNGIPTDTTATPAQTTPAPTTPKVKPTTSSKPTDSPTSKAGSHNHGGKEGLSSVAIIIIVVLLIVLLILIGIMVTFICCYCRGKRCREILKRPFANGQLIGQMNGNHLNGQITCDEKLYEEMANISNNIGHERQPLVPPTLPPHPNLSPTRVDNQPPPPPPEWSPTNSSYMSAIPRGQDVLRVTLPRQISHPVQDTTPHTPGSGGSASNNFEAMNQFPSDGFLSPAPGFSQVPIHPTDDRVSDGITEVKQQSSPIPCTEENNILPAFPTNLSDEEFVHRNRAQFMPGERALEHGECAAKENEEETQPKIGNQSANSSLQRPGNDHFVSLNQGTDKKHLMPNYTEVDKAKVNHSTGDKVRDGANYMGDAKLSPNYVDMEKKPNSNSDDKDPYQDEAYESVGPSNYTHVTKDTKDSSITSDHSVASGKS
ncbi:uncharacterized protein LOC132549430 [Ylistrum balloti]|uniref:uncharacterized protein LOC132549430 n=1 Tax=Ylistrum balloti TaxID=509963 RepID=UPI002905E157|nr:uncharacterized protein LOC132549430 [Ylistrum balloti]